MRTNDDWPDYDGSAQLADKEAHVWAVPLDVRQTAVDAMTRCLSDHEIQRAGDFRVEDARRRFVVARAALRKLLGTFLDLDAAKVSLVLGESKKPALAVSHALSKLRFNVSHSGDLALIAITSGCEVGVDVERARSVGHSADIARIYFHAAEKDAVLKTPPGERDLAFLRCWTAKEAVLKAIGSGITGSLAEFQVSVDERWNGWVDCQGLQCWVQRLALGKDYIGAVACVGRERSLRYWTFNI